MDELRFTFDLDFVQNRTYISGSHYTFGDNDMKRVDEITNSYGVEIDIASEKDDKNGYRLFCHDMILESDNPSVHDFFTVQSEYELVIRRIGPHSRASKDEGEVS